MPGLLTHLGVAFGGLIIITLLSNWKYGLAFLTGQLIPDIIKFGIPAIRRQTSSFTEMMRDPIYWQLNNYTHHIYMWIALSIIVLVITFALYKYQKINKKNFKTWLFINLFFFISIVIHLIMDFFIIESSYWI